MARKGFHDPRYVIYALMALIVVGAFSILGNGQTQKQKQKENYERPKPTHPIQPSIPGTNRYQEDKVFLENADSLYRPANEFEEFQIVKGTVKFRQGGMWMFCDSAYYYPEKNSLDAFGHVEMRQGDTLFVYADKLYYDGISKHASLTHGPSRGNVTLKDPKVTLTTDSLDYDVATETGWYSTGGKLQDDLNTLTSRYGEYSPATKLARFRDNVVLVNNKDGFHLYSEELDYNTANHIAYINTRTRIEGKTDTIITRQGWYDTQNDHAQLTSRSTIIHTDSAKNVTTLEGDSIIYDKLTRVSRAYKFRDKRMHPQEMVITDTARKVIIIGGYGEYNDSTRTAFATEYPLLIEYSRPDTLFLRADTILSYISSQMVWPDSLKRAISSEARARLRKFSSLAELAADLGPLTLNLLPRDFPEPGAWLKEQEAKAKAEEEAKAKAEEDAKAEEEARMNAEEVEKSEEEVRKNEEKENSTENSDEIIIESGEVTEVLNESQSPDESPGADNSINENLEGLTGKEELTSITSPGDTLFLAEEISLELDSVKKAASLDSIHSRVDAFGRDSIYMVPKDFHIAMAISRARFFQNNLQGVADTIILRS